MIRASIGLVAFATRALAFSCSVNPVQIPLQAKNGISLRAQASDLVFGISIARTDTEAWGGDLAGGATDLVLTGQKIEIEDYEVKKVADGPDRGSTDGNIGVGSNSSFIQLLKDEDEIPARSYGLSYSPGAKSPSELKMDSIVLGGYDSAAVDGKFYESDLSADTRLGVDVQIKQMTVIKSNGDRTDLLARPIAAKLNNELREVLMPSAIAMDYSSLVGGSEYDIRHLQNFIPPWMLEPEGYRILRQNSLFTGSLLISLTNGFTATIPAELLSSNFTSSDSTSKIISSVLSVNLDHVVLGTVFLSQAYLAVDYENMKLSLAKRATKSSGKARLKALGCDFKEKEEDDDDDDTTSNQRSRPSSASAVSSPAQTSSSSPSSSSSSSSSKPSKNTILGAVLGSLLSVIAILLLILFLVRRRKRNQRLGYNRRSLHSTKGLGYHQYSEASNSRLLSTDHAPLKREEAGASTTEIPAAAFLHPPAPRSSFTPSIGAASRRTDGPGRNSYFKEDLDDP